VIWSDDFAQRLTLLVEIAGRSLSPEDARLTSVGQFDAIDKMFGGTHASLPETAKYFADRCLGTLVGLMSQMVHGQQRVSDLPMNERRCNDWVVSWVREDKEADVLLRAAQPLFGLPKAVERPHGSG
jgi:hypothetical protein